VITGFFKENTCLIYGNPYEGIEILDSVYKLYLLIDFFTRQLLY